MQLQQAELTLQEELQGLGNLTKSGLYIGKKLAVMYLH